MSGKAMISYRRATTDDVDAIARLHADSWRRNYRGAYPDWYLDGDLVAERRAAWSERLSAAGESTITLVAEDEGAVVGFAHSRLDDHGELGALLDNLHVAHALRRSGIGTRLMAETAAAVLNASPGSGLYLRVLEQNTAAQAFYEARGGRTAGRDLAKPIDADDRVFVFLYSWPDPSTLLVDR